MARTRTVNWKKEVASLKDPWVRKELLIVIEDYTDLASKEKGPLSYTQKLQSNLCPMDWQHSQRHLTRTAPRCVMEGSETVCKNPLRTKKQKQSPPPTQTIQTWYLGFQRRQSCFQNGPGKSALEYYCFIYSFVSHHRCVWCCTRNTLQGRPPLQRTYKLINW